MERVRHILDNDRIVGLFGMELLSFEPGKVRIQARVAEEFLNAHRIAHGAFIFALADVAFAIVVNAETDAVGVQWSFNTFRAAMPGETVTAECRLLHRGRSLLVVEYDVVGESGKLLAKGQATALPASRDRFTSPAPGK
ncbi:MAG: PaaI family thioesterase [Deltaproteobacteria bacterium]|nr:MAG: PaaI family thioesterase [Deltaproteobacteria bacterium]